MNDRLSLVCSVRCGGSAGIRAERRFHEVWEAIVVGIN